MAQNKILHSIFFIIVIPYILDGCSNSVNRVYFCINPENRQIIIPVHINDSTIANLIFDTTAFLTLDSSFCASNHTNIDMNSPDASAKMSSAWTYNTAKGTVYNKSKVVKIGNIDLIYQSFYVCNWKNYMNSNVSDGIFGIPPQDSTHVWELNFEHNYLEIHLAERFQMPKNCFIVPIDRDSVGHYTFEIQLPMKIKYADGDTLTMNRTYFVDTGMFWDIALMPTAKEMEFFNRKKDAVWTQTSVGDKYNRRYTVNAKLFNNFVMDSLYIYTFDNPYQINSKYLLGQNFLKRFNVFFDLKKGQIGLQPIKNFQRVVNPLSKRFHYSTVKTHDGKTIVSKVADYPANYIKAAGLREGDEIVTINGNPYDNYSYDYLQYNRNTFINVLRNKNITREDSHYFKDDTLVFDISRQGKPMKIVAPIDKNEVLGD